MRGSSLAATSDTVCLIESQEEKMIDSAIDELERKADELYARF